MDTNRILMIDPAARKIEVPEKERIIGVYQDHDSERKYFKCPRIVGDNVDLSQHRIYINYVPSKINGTFNEEEEVGSYLCEDVATDGDYVTFSWKISDNVTREAGYIAFAVFAKKADADGNLKTKWHTTPAIGNVLDTLPDGDQIVSRYPDIIEQIMERLDRIGEIDPEQIAEAVEKHMAAHPFEETDPTVSDWAKQPEKPTYTAEEVGADASGTAESKVSVHNTATDSHNDIRILVQGLTERLNALADSDDTTLDQMSELVAYIKSNKSLIDAITTSKVSVSDIIDNLTTNVSNKPLSAAQGVALKALIDGITTVGLDETLTDNTKAAPAGMVGEMKEDISSLSEDFINQAEVDDDGLVSFKNSKGLTLFTLDLSEFSGGGNVYGELVISTESLSINEGESGTFTVKLATAPTTNQVVYLAVSDNTKLSVSPSNLTFSPTDYSTEQTVTVTALGDEDSDDETITISLTSKKVSAKSLLVSIADDDIALVEDGLTLYYNLRNGDLTDSVGSVVATNGGTIVDGGVKLESNNTKFQFVYPVKTENIPNGATVELALTGLADFQGAGNGYGTGYAYRNIFYDSSITAGFAYTANGSIAISDFSFSTIE